MEIENILHSHPKVLEAAVIGVVDEHWGEIVKAVIMLKPKQHVSGDEIMEFCHANLASYKNPVIVEFVDDFPRNAMGKILKTTLRGETSK